MIADKIEFLGNYPQLEAYRQTIDDFIEKAKAGMPDGRYDILGDELYALVQHYTNHLSEGSRMEAHEHYADLQCVISGREYIYVDYVKELTISEDCHPDVDCMFFEIRPPKGGNIIEAGCFGYYGPTDAHMPGCAVGEPEDVFKIVFKIKVA